jgi:hypothetical protein
LKVEFSNRQRIEFRQGKFDSWCVYVVHGSGSEKNPLDKELFQELITFGSICGNFRIYTEIIQVYTLSRKDIEREVLNKIVEISNRHEIKNIESIKILYTKFYYAFVAEENRARTVLGKRVKMLGIYQIMLENFSPEDTANFSKGMTGKAIADLCTVRGF